MKHKYIFKFLSALLVILMAFSVFACSQGGSGENAKTTVETDSGQNASEESEPEATEPQRIWSEAPVNDYGGYTFRILSKEAQTADHHWEAFDIVAEEDNSGDPINDAVYSRNTTIAEKYNISITRVDTADPAGLASRSVKAGSDDYDLAFPSLSSAVSAAQNGTFIDLKKMPYIDLEKPWYDQNANAQLSIGGKLYATFCDFTVLDKNSTWVYLFSKQLIKDLELEDPYQLVREGKWTLDKLTEMCRGAAKDLDGDGTITWKDQFGWQGEGWNMYAGVIASGIQIIQKNADDLPEYAGLGDQGLSAFAKLLEVFGDKEMSLRAESVTSYSGNLWNDVMDASFMEGRILFSNTGMNRVTLFRSMETDFGIIPNPKYDEATPDYYNTLSMGQATALCVPATIADSEMVAILTDALCAESKYTLIPAYYDVQLKTKFARDEDSAEMLDLIFASRRFELSLVYGWGDFSGTFSTAMIKNDPNIASSLEKIEQRLITAMEKTIAAYDKNEN
ncbi:MAG: hypothetical protein FWH48_00995 [Oscillospiraceae bacterium]|nr:hypothetical protein [Oscillospiraceae bacterium]